MGAGLITLRAQAKLAPWSTASTGGMRTTVRGRAHDTGGDMLAFSIWEAIWLVFVTFIFISVLMMLFSVIVDLFRDDSLSGWGKAGWIIVLIAFPFLGLLIYVIARGKGMTERSFK